MKSNARTRSFAMRAAWYRRARSASIWRGAPGRCTFTATRRPFERHGPLAPREEIRQPVTLEHVAEPVPDEDLRDLREPAEVPRRRAGHGISMTLALVAALALAGGAAARIRVPPAYRARVVARGLDHPTAMAFGPDGRLYVTENGGAVVAVDPRTRGLSPFLRGLPTPLGLAWHGRTLFVSVAGGVRSVRLHGDRATAQRTIVRGLPFGRHQQDNVLVGRAGRP